jgi:hypothetical protein
MCFIIPVVYTLTSHISFVIASFIGFNTNCERERYRALGWTGLKVRGLWIPDCAPDGSYEPIQCHPASGYCWCVDRDGHELFGTRVKGKRTCKNISGELAGSICSAPINSFSIINEQQAIHRAGRSTKSPSIDVNNNLVLHFCNRF